MVEVDAQIGVGPGQLMVVFRIAVAADFHGSEAALALAAVHHVVEGARHTAVECQPQVFAAGEVFPAADSRSSAAVGLRAEMHSVVGGRRTVVELQHWSVAVVHCTVVAEAFLAADSCLVVVPDFVSELSMALQVWASYIAVEDLIVVAENQALARIR